jgi:putative ABC transport system substrate-binding protein
VVAVDVRDPREIEKAFATMARTRVGAFITAPDEMFFAHRDRVLDLAAKNRLLGVFDTRAFVEAGGFMAYGPSVSDQFRHAATYVDKILKGARPAELPIEQPTKFELVINLKTAKSLSLTIPQSVLARADDVIQ